MSNTQDSHRQTDIPTIVLIAMIAGYVAFFSVMTVRQHDALLTHVFDLGNVDQTLWNTVHGRPLHFTTQPAVGEHRMGMHVEPVLFGIALSYLVYPSPKVLLGLQTLALALGAVPLYAIARRRLGTPWSALAFPCAYLMSPALQATNLFEFHAVAFAPAFLLAAFYFMDRVTWPAETGAPPRKGLTGSWVLYGVFVLLALSCKEDISLIVILLGAYLALIRKHWLAGILTSIAGGIWFCTAVYAIIPHFRPSGSPFLAFYVGLGDNPATIAWNLLTQPQLFLTYVLSPENLRALGALLIPYAGLPLLGFPFWLLAGPSLGIDLLSNNPLMHRMERYHYAAPLIPVIVTAGIYGVDWLSRTLAARDARRRVSAVQVLAILVVTCTLWYHYHRGFTPLARAFSWPEVSAHHRLIDRVVASIPADAVISAQANLFPHLSQRERAYLWPDPRDKEYVALDVSDPSFWNRDGAQEGLKRDVEQDASFGWVLAEDGYLVLQKGAPLRPLPDEFYSFVRVDEATPRYAMTVDFGDAIRFLGFTPLYEREEEVRFRLYFEALRPTAKDYAITLYLIDAEGNVVGGTDRPQPALVWYPTSRWEQGETIEVIANTLPWWTGDKDTYAIALGVSESNDTWDVGARLPVRTQDSAWVTPVIDDGTLLQLMTVRRSWELHYPEAVRRRYTPPEMAHATQASFAGKAELAGYTLRNARVHPGDTLEVILYWKATARWESSYKVFVQLLSAEGQVVAQQDTVPGEGRFPTDNWLPGEYITDGHHLVVGEDTRAGHYHLIVGFYDPATMARLPVTGEPNIAPENHVVLDQEIEISNR